MESETLTLLLSHEISSVITAMRYNSKWAVVPRYYEEDRNEPSRYDDAFRTLLSEIYQHEDWNQVDPLLYLTPFLSLIKASDVSGPITGAAAVALQRILASNLITPATVNAEAAINQIVEDATQCKFESTNNAQDEVVLLNIVQVLEQAVQCRAGVLLADRTLCSSFQAAFMLGDPVSKPKEYGDIMGYYSRQACGNMVHTLFTRLRHAASTPSEDGDEGSLDGRISSGGILCSSNGTVVVQGSMKGMNKHGVDAALEILDYLADLIRRDPMQGPTDLVEETIVFALDMVHSAMLAVGHELVLYDTLVAQVHVELLHAVCQAVINFPSISIISGFCHILLAMYTFIGTISIGQIELVMEKVLLKLADGKGVSTLEQQEAALEGILELVRTPGFIHDVFVNCDCRLQRGNLFMDLIALLSRTALPHSGTKMSGGIGGAGLGPLHAVSLEALLAILRAIAAENKPDNFVPPPPELELPCFVDVWSALAAGEHPDLTPLMRAASAGKSQQKPAGGSPAGAGSRPIHSPSALGSPGVTGPARGSFDQQPQQQQQQQSPQQLHVSAPHGGLASAGSSGNLSTGAHRERLASGAHASPSGNLMPGSTRGGGRKRPSDYERLESAVYEKHLKGKVMLAVEHFNKDHKKGFQYLQANRLMPVLAGSPAATAATAAAAAAAAANGLSYMPPIGGVVSEDELAMCLGRFLHVCPRLNKVAIGELLGEPDAFYLKVLDAYTASFNFRDLRFDAAIRLFLESFRLPGEAQKIDRIINSFGIHYYNANPSIFRSADAAYVLAYSVIMLNTDRHNAQIKQKMSLESFRKNLRGVNEGADFPAEFLNQIFHSIASTPLRMSEDSSLQISEQQLMELHQISCLPRGQMVHADPGRHLFDVSMFRLMWQPTVTAMAAIVECAQPPPLAQVLPSLSPDVPALERGGISPSASQDNVSTATDTPAYPLARSHESGLVAEYPGTLKSMGQASRSWAGGSLVGPIMPLIDSALDGLQVAAAIAAQHSLDDVTDTVLVHLTRLPIMHLAHLPTNSSSSSSLSGMGGVRGDVALGKDPKLLAVTRTVATITNRYGDCLGASGWESVMEMIVVLYRCGALPDSFCAALAGDGEGGLVVRPGEANSLRVRRAAAARAQAANSGTSIFRSLTSILGGSMSDNLDYAGTDGRSSRDMHLSPPAPHLAGLSEEDCTAASVADEVLCRCAFEDIFVDSKFLRQDSLGHLMHAIIHASGPIPRPSANGTGGSGTGGSAYAAAGAGITGGWDVAELCLELLFTMLLRNRDRISALWPRVYAHFQTIFSCSREVEPVLVQKAVMAMMRLCQRLLPYKPDITESLVKGVQLVSLVDEQVASDMASTIASEVHDLLKGAAPYLATQQVWMAIMGLIKIIQYDPSSFLACVDTLAWVAAEALTPLNFAIVLQTTVDLLERAAEYAVRAPPGAPGSVLASLDLAIGASTGTSSPAHQQARAQLQQHLLALSTVPAVSASGASAPEAAAAKAAAVASSAPRQSTAATSTPTPTGGASVVRDPFSPGAGAASPTHPGDPVISVLLSLLRQSEEWLEVWWIKGGGASHTHAHGRGAGDPGIAIFKQEAWSHVMSCLCRAIKSPNLQIRNGALECLQRSVVAAEKFAVPPPVVQRVLMQLLVPMTQDLVRKVAVTNPAVLHREFPQADVAVRELVRALAKVVLLYAPQMRGEAAQGGAPPLSSWGPAWRGILDCLVAAMTQAAPRSELLAEAIPEATKNMVLMLLNKGVLPRGSPDAMSGGQTHTWRDATDGSDLCEITWWAAKRVSANLTPSLLM